MRTAPLALAFLDRDEAGLWQAAMDISALTHFDPEAGEACALWSVAIRRAILTGELDLRGGLRFLPPERADVWRRRIETAEASRPRDFAHNGWVVEAFQGACSAITTESAGMAGPVTSGPDLLRRALEEAVRGGNDTDTVAAIAGGLLGAVYGWSAVPFEWRRDLHGWPGYTARDLLRLGSQLVRGRGRTPGSWPEVGVFDNSGFISDDRTDVVAHPLDPDVVLGGTRPCAGTTTTPSSPSAGSAPPKPTWLSGTTPRSGWSIRRRPRTTRTWTSCSGTRRPPSRCSGPRASGCCCTVSGQRAGLRPWRRCTDPWPPR